MIPGDPSTGLGGPILYARNKKLIDSRNPDLTQLDGSVILVVSTSSLDIAVNYMV